MMGVLTDVLRAVRLAEAVFFVAEFRLRSRSALAGRFTDLIGESPMPYLTGWRMHLASQLLCEGHRSLAEVDERVGYESE